MEEQIANFARQLGLESEAVSFMFEMPVEIQLYIMDNFDASGSKDGNVMGRLQGYARHLLRRSGHPIPHSLAPAQLDQGAAAGYPSAAPVVQGSTIGAAPMAMGSDASGFSRGPVPALAEFSHRIGLTPEAQTFISSLPSDVQNQIIRGFDPSGTKDGNVWGRLMGYARSIWSRSLGLDQDTITLLRGLPEEYQLTVMMEFDVHGSKDGNFSERLQRFINMVQIRGVQTQPASVARPVATSRPVVHTVVQQQYAAPQQPTQQHTAAIGSADISGFAQRLNLDHRAVEFLQGLPADVTSIVVSKFDPSGTKDGNVWGRLLGYIRHVWGRQKGVDQATMDQLRQLPEEEQMAQITASSSMMQAASSLLQVPTGIPAAGTYQTRTQQTPLQQFVQTWQLNSNAEAFLAALPGPVTNAVIAGFDGSASKDGNVWQRLLGFARQQWSKSLGLDSTTSAALKALPEEAQMLCFTQFDPSSSKDGNIGARLQKFIGKCVRQVQHQEALTQHVHAAATAQAHYAGAQYAGAQYASEQYAGAAAYAIASLNQGYAQAAHTQPDAAPITDPIVLDFMQRCRLDTSAEPLLQSLPEELLHTCLREFDPSNSKDGNTLGRLQGYVKSLCRKRGVPMGPDGLPAKRMRLM